MWEDDNPGLCVWLTDMLEHMWDGIQGLVSRVLMVAHVFQGSKFHSSDRLRRVIMTVGQVQYLQELSDGRLGISDFDISCIGFICFRQVNGTFGQVIFTIHLPDGQVHSV